MGVKPTGSCPTTAAEADECAAAFVEAGAIVAAALPLAPGAPNTEFSEIEIEGAQFVHARRTGRRSGAPAASLPDITVGHSLGEIGAAYVAGTITLADAVGRGRRPGRRASTGCPARTPWRCWASDARRRAQA